MKIRCAWHPKYWGFEKEMGEKCLEQSGTTDSICPRCLRRFEREVNKSKNTSIAVKHTTDVTRYGHMAYPAYAEVNKSKPKREGKQDAN